MSLFDSIKYPIDSKLRYSDIAYSLPPHFREIWKQIYLKYVWGEEIPSEQYAPTMTLFERAVAMLQEYIYNYDGEE